MFVLQLFGLYAEQAGRSQSTGFEPLPPFLQYLYYTGRSYLYCFTRPAPLCLRYRPRVTARLIQATDRSNMPPVWLTS